jgi:galactokinase
MGDAVQRAKHVYTEARRVHAFRAATLQSDRYMSIMMYSNHSNSYEMYKLFTTT